MTLWRPEGDAVLMTLDITTNTAGNNLLLDAAMISFSDDLAAGI